MKIPQHCSYSTAYSVTGCDIIRLTDNPCEKGLNGEASKVKKTIVTHQFAVSGHYSGHSSVKECGQQLSDQSNGYCDSLDSTILSTHVSSQTEVDKRNVTVDLPAEPEPLVPVLKLV